MRVSSYSPAPISQPVAKAQSRAELAQHGRSNFLDSVSIAAPASTANKSVVAAAAVGRQLTVASIGRPTVVSAKIPSPSSDAPSAATPTSSEPSAMARLFGWSSTTPKEPAPLQTTAVTPTVTPTVERTANKNLGVDSLAALTNSLRARGVNPDSLGLRYSEEESFYPGGSYTNKLITANINGETANFGAELVLKNPEITSTEILRFLGGRYA